MNATSTPSPEPVKIRWTACPVRSTGKPSDSSEQIRKYQDNALAQAYIDSLAEVAS